MRNIILVLLFIAPFGYSENICQDFESKIEPDFRWKESDFTKEASLKAMTEISDSIHENEMLATFQLPNNLTLIEGYVLKRDAIRALSGEVVHKGLIEYHVTNFCEFLVRTPIYD